MDRPTPHLDTASAARRAGVSGDTIRRWCRLGYLHPIRVGVGRRYRIDADELDAVIDGTVPSSHDTGALAGSSGTPLGVVPAWNATDGNNEDKVADGAGPALAEVVQP